MAPNQTPDDELDALLRQAFEGPVADDGFSARVVRALPPRRTRATRLVPAAALGGSVAAWLALSPLPLWREVTSEALAGSLGTASLTFISLLVVLGALGCAWALEESA